MFNNLHLKNIVFLGAQFRVDAKRGRSLDQRGRYGHGQNGRDHFERLRGAIAVRSEGYVSILYN